jgi:hypothetical protein
VDHFLDEEIPALMQAIEAVAPPATVAEVTV